MNIAIIGASGAGKGTHSASLCAKFGLRHVAVGELFRAHVRGHTALGTLARRYMEQLELVPDEIVDAMLDDWLAHLPTDRGALIDGFPQTTGQARSLDELLRRHGRKLDAVVYLHVPDPEIVHRLAGRFICQNCRQPYHQQENPPEVYGVCNECGGELYHRPDESTELVHARLRVFQRAAAPLLDYYCARNRLLLVHGDDNIPETAERLMLAVQSIRDGKPKLATATEVGALPRPSAPVATAPHLARESLDVVLLGPPGSGKRTQAQLLSTRLHLPHIEPGQVFRDSVLRSTRLGKAAHGYMDRGEWVPSDITDGMIEERLAKDDAAAGFILDGFPQTLHQALGLADHLARQRRRLTAAVYLNVPDETAVRRLSGRMVCPQCRAPYHEEYSKPQAAGRCDRCGAELYQRPDDSPSSVRARLSTFQQHVEPVLALYRRMNLLHELDGSRDPAAVAAAILLELPPGTAPVPGADAVGAAS